MVLSQRIQDIQESITLKLNDQANAMAEQGRIVYNLTAGQLPFKPMPDFIKDLEIELNLLKSFQYSPVAGHKELRKKILERTQKTREIDLQYDGIPFEVVISNGAKQSLYNILGCILNPGDECMIFSPYWISYPEMIKLWGGETVIVEGQKYNYYLPLISEIKKNLGKKTKAIILNSPNNPTGTHYPITWMKDFADLLSDYPDITVISDEIYFDLVYFDPRPTYFYQLNPKLLKQTVIVDGISKTFACTGLRIGYSLCRKEIAEALVKIQGQTTSGANSLVQRALMTFNFEKIKDFLGPIKIHLRNNSSLLQRKFREKGLETAWYQTNSAFYFLVDFTRTPIYEKKCRQKKLSSEHAPDLALEICEELLSKKAVALVPGTDFGAPNTGRISLVLEESILSEALDLVLNYLIEET
jgi:aspartate aminotransferase